MRSSALIDDLSQSVASTLGIAKESVTIERWRFSGRPPTIVHCRGSAGDERFFSKIYLADPYPAICRVQTLWESLQSPGKDLRSVQEQIEIEWSTTARLRALVGAEMIPAPLAKSLESKAIVWQQVTGVRLDRLTAIFPWQAVKGDIACRALWRAGTWLRSVHDKTMSGNEIVPTSPVVEMIRELCAKHERFLSRPIRETLHKLESVLIAPTGGKLTAPIAFSHGDFSLPNLMFDRQSDRLFVFDFEHSGHRSICHDLLTMVLSIRGRLRNPLYPKRWVELAETSFWAGYGGETISPAVVSYIKTIAWLRIIAGRLAPAGNGSRMGRLTAACSQRVGEYLLMRRLEIPDIQAG